MFAEKILLLAVSFFVGIYVARYLGPSQYGLFNYAISFVFLFQAFSRLGLDGIIVRNLLQFPENKNKILGTSIVLKSAASLISFSFILISILFVESDFQTKILVVIIAGCMIFSGFDTAQFWFESQVKAKYNAIVNSVSVLIASVIKVILLISNSDLILFAAVFSAEMIFKQFGYLFFYQYQNKDISTLKYDISTAKKMMKDALPLLFSSISVMLYMRIDQVMIKEMLDDRQTGLYSAAVNLSELWYFIPVIISNSIFPAIIDAREKSKKFYEKRLQQLYNLMSLISVILMFPIAIFGHEIINIIYGQSYCEAGSVLQIHILSLLFVFWGTASGKWLLAENYVTISLYRAIAGALVNIVANVFLIKYYGISGAAIATLLAYMTAGFLFDIFYKKTHISFVMKCKSLNLFGMLRKK